MKNKAFGFVLQPGRDGGFWWTVRDMSGRICGLGFSAGRKSATKDARDRIAELMAKKAAA